MVKRRRSTTAWMLLVLAMSMWGALLSPAVLAAPPEPADCSTPTYNLLQNKNCGVEVTIPDSYWHVSNAYVTIERSTDQVHNGSYAMKITGSSAWSINTSAGGQTIKTSNPIPVTPNTGYSFAAWVYIPSTATRVNAGRLRVAWYTAADCSGSQLSTSTTEVTAVDTWTYGWLQASSPATANCAQLRLFIQTPTTGAGTVGPVYFDNVMFYESSPTAVTLDAFHANPTGLGVPMIVPIAGLLMLGAIGFLHLRRRA